MAHLVHGPPIPGPGCGERGVDAFGVPALQRWDDGIVWVAWRREHMVTRLSEEVGELSNAEEPTRPRRCTPRWGLNRPMPKR